MGEIEEGMERFLAKHYMGKVSEAITTKIEAFTMSKLEFEFQKKLRSKIEENPSNARGIATEGEKVYPNGAKVSFALKPEIIPDGDSLARTTVMKPMAKREFSMTNARDTPLLSDTKLNPFSDSHVDNLPKVDSNREAIDENNENKGNLRSRAWRLFVEML